MERKYEAAYSGYVYEKPKTHWSSEADVKAKLSKVNLRSNQIKAGGLPIVSDGKTAYIDTGDSHTAINAISGMKKSICAFMPLIYTLGKARENMVITDPKAELFTRTAGYLDSLNYNIKCLDFRTLDKDGYNILEYPARTYRSGDTDKGMMMVNDLVNVFAERARQTCKDVFWPDTAAMWKSGTAGLMFDAYPKLEMINICNWAKFDIYRNMDVLRNFITEIKADNTCMINLKAVMTSAENTLRSILITASAFLSPFIQNDKLARMLSHSTFSLDDLCKDKTALFIITDDTTTTCDTIVGIIISQIQTYLVDCAYKNKSGKLDKRVNFVLDEFTSYPIPNMAVALATHRSRGLRYYLCCQSISGLKKRYDDYEAILANCGTTLFLGSTEKEMLERISDQCGKTNITIDGKEKPLISPAELMTLKKSWESKEAIYMNLSESIRYCVSLPSIEAYALGNHEIKNNVIAHPKIEAYTISNLIRDISCGNAVEPFSEKKEAPKAKKTQPKKKSNISADESTTDLQKELERKFDELFGALDSDDDD